jgi:16S rRNA (guanine966-N2)-methyltransferase
VASLGRAGFDALRVLDPFAGSGALGIEALSRKAAFCVFAEADRRAAETIRANLAQLGLDTPQRTALINRDVFLPASLKAIVAQGPFDLVALDPPYEMSQGRIRGLLSDLARAGAVGGGTLISYEQAFGMTDEINGVALTRACSPLSLEMVSCKTYGTTQIRYYFCR